MASSRKVGRIMCVQTGEKHYTIIIQGHLDKRWEDCFPGMDILLLPEGRTRFTGMVADQAALHGMLNRIGDLCLPLLLVIRSNFEIQ